MSRPKDKFSLLPAHELRELAAIMTDGIADHEPEGWKGQSPAEHYDAAMRHLTDWMKGPHTSDHGHNHLLHAACRCILGAAVERDNEDRLAKLIRLIDEYQRITAMMNQTTR